MFAEIKYDGERVQVGFKVGDTAYSCFQMSIKSNYAIATLTGWLKNPNIPLNHTSS